MSGDSVGVHLDQRKAVTQHTELQLRRKPSLNSNKEINVCCILSETLALLCSLKLSEVRELKQKQMFFTVCHIITPGLRLRTEVTWKADGRVLVVRTVQCPLSCCWPRKYASWVETEWPECPMLARV